MLSVNARFPGSVHDSAIRSNSNTRIHLVNTYSDRNWSSLFGDSGYPLEPWLLIPFGGNTQNPLEKRFNKKHKATRNIVERTFGLLKARFRSVHQSRCLYYKPQVAANIIYAVCIIHNFLLRRGDQHIQENDFFQNENEN